MKDRKEAHVAYWQAALTASADHPLVGTGPGTFGGDFLIYSRETRRRNNRCRTRTTVS